MNTAIILAAGKGTRMNSDRNKQFIEILGKPIIAYTLETFNNCTNIDKIIVVAAEGEIEHCKVIVDFYGFHKVKQIVVGGNERQESVQKGLEFLDNNCKIALIHDGARMLVTQDIINDCIEGAFKYGAVTAGVPVKDTIKTVVTGNIISSTPDRSTLWITQTPQAFKADIIINSHKYARENYISVTDDAALAEKAGYEVRMVKAEYENIKITTNEDLYLAEILLERRSEAVE